MTAPDRSTAPADAALQFDQAEATAAAPAAAGVTCANCRKTLTGVYHMLNAAIICSTCRQRLEKELKGGSGSGRFAKALLFGLGGAAVGSLIYYAVLAATGMEIGLIAILVGWLVGRGVHKGSAGRGGFTYQAMAMVLTYFAIVSTYIPLLVKGFQERTSAARAVSHAAAPAAAADSSVAAGDSAAQAQAPAPARAKPTLGTYVVAAAAMLAIAAVVPFLAGIGNIIGLLIIGFALYQAWKMNRSPTLAFTGPFRVGGAPAPA